MEDIMKDHYCCAYLERLYGHFCSLSGGQRRVLGCWSKASSSLEIKTTVCKQTECKCVKEDLTIPTFIDRYGIYALTIH